MNLQDCLARLDSALDAIRQRLTRAEISRPDAILAAKKEVETLANENPDFAVEIRKHGALRLFLEEMGAQNHDLKAPQFLRQNVRVALEKDAKKPSFWRNWSVLAPKIAWGGGLAATGAFLLVVASPILLEQAQTPFSSTSSDAVFQSEADSRAESGAAPQKLESVEVPNTQPKSAAKNGPTARENQPKSPRQQSTIKKAAPNASPIQKTPAIPAKPPQTLRTSEPKSSQSSATAKIERAAPPVKAEKAPATAPAPILPDARRETTSKPAPAENLAPSNSNANTRAKTIAPPTKMTPARPSIMARRAQNNQLNDAGNFSPSVMAPAPLVKNAETSASAEADATAEGQLNQAPARFQIAIVLAENSTDRAPNTLNLQGRSDDATRKNAPTASKVAPARDQADNARSGATNRDFRARENNGRPKTNAAPRLFKFRFSSEIALSNAQIVLNLVSKSQNTAKNSDSESLASQTVWRGDLAAQMPLEAEISLSGAPGTVFEAVLEQKTAGGASKVVATQNLVLP